MGPTTAGVLQLVALTGALALVHIPLGNHMARVYSSRRHLRIEKWIYQGIGADPDTEMTWTAYLRGVLAFSAVGVLFLYGLQRLQGVLPGSLGFDAIDPDQAFNTAVSFVTNTNWQSYYGEQAMGHVVQTPGSPCRTSSPRPSAWPSPWRWCAASHGPVPVSWGTSGPTWCAVSYACCCRWRSSPRSCWSPAG